MKETKCKGLPLRPSALLCDFAVSPFRELLITLGAADWFIRLCAVLVQFVEEGAGAGGDDQAGADAEGDSQAQDDPEDPGARAFQAGFELHAEDTGQGGDGEED